MSTILRVGLIGEQAELGRIAASDVARLLLGVERTLGRAATHVIGRESKSPGRRGRAVEESTRLRLSAIEEGSLIAVLELPEQTRYEQTLDIEAPTLGDLALNKALATAAGQAVQELDVAEALVTLADDVGVGTRFKALTFEEQRPRGPNGPRVVTLDRPARDRLSKLVSAPPHARDDSLIGVLVEADFESNTAQLRTPARKRVNVTFEPELADKIQEVLRRQAELVGEVTYDPKNLEARAVKLRRIVHGEQLMIGLDAGEYWQDSHIDRLAAEQGVRRADDLEELHDKEASSEEIDRFLVALDEM